MFCCLVWTEVLFQIVLTSSAMGQMPGLVLPSDSSFTYQVLFRNSCSLNQFPCQVPGPIIFAKFHTQLSRKRVYFNCPVLSSFQSINSVSQYCHVSQYYNVQLLSIRITYYYFRSFCPCLRPFSMQVPSAAKPS